MNKAWKTSLCYPELLHRTQSRQHIMLPADRSDEVNDLPIGPKEPMADTVPVTLQIMRENGQTGIERTEEKTIIILGKDQFSS